MGKKRWVLIILSFAVFILWQFGCKKNPLIGDEIFYDIRGKWTIIRHFNGVFTEKSICTFSGEMDSGTVTPESGVSGKYSVGGEHGYHVDFQFGAYDDNPLNYYFYTGKFIDSNNMEGSARWFVWSAVREVGTK